jgi:hypothetical protein
MALATLDLSKRAAAVGAVLAFLGLLVTLWMPGKSDDAHPTQDTNTRPPPRRRTRGACST